MKVPKTDSDKKATDESFTSGCDEDIHGGGEDDAKKKPDLESSAEKALKLIKKNSSSICKPKNKTGVRCHECAKKVGIVARFDCRCGNIFCSTHRYPESHKCSIDYKEEGRKELKKNMPVIAAEKISKI